MSLPAVTAYSTLPAASANDVRSALDAIAFADCLRFNLAVRYLVEPGIVE